jgi:hypothetical protein
MYLQALAVVFVIAVVSTRNHLEAQRIGSVDQGGVHPGEQCKAEKEGLASVHGQRRQHSNAKSGGRRARGAYPLSLLDVGCAFASG